MVINFLHTFNPSPIAFQIGKITIYWYGFLIAIGAILAYMVCFFITKKIIKKPILFLNFEDLIFYLIIFGIIGARIYHVLAQLPYYAKHPLEVFYIWEGGLGIFGAIIAGILVIYFYAKKSSVFERKSKAILTLTDILAPGVVLAQAIGRWGNYFNSELFGKPTSLSWGIPIPFLKRPDIYSSFQYFHPTFLYESLWNLSIFVVLLVLAFFFIKKRSGIVTGFYLIFYPLGRFLIEFIRIDYQPKVFGLRMAQIFCIVSILIGIWLLIKSKKLSIKYQE